MYLFGTRCISLELKMVADPVTSKPSQTAQSGQTKSGMATNKSVQDKENEKAKQEALKLRKELDQRVKSMTERANGAQRNLDNSRKALKEYKASWNIFRKMGGEKKALEKIIRTDRNYRDKLVKQQQGLIRTQNRVKELMKKGEFARAKAILKGKEQEYLSVQKSRQQFIKAGQKAMKGIQDASKDLQKTDEFLGKVETGMRYTRDGCVVAAAIVATGGAASGGFIAAAAAGTAAGTVVGGASNLTRAVADQSYGTGNYGFTDALKDTGKDGLTSLQIGLSGGAGAGAAKGTASLIGKEAMKRTGARVVVGMTAGGTSGFTGANLQTATNIAMGTEQRSVRQIITDTRRMTVVGMLSGGIGARGQAGIDNAVANGTNSMTRVLATRAVTDVAAPVTISVISAYTSAWITGDKAPTREQIFQEATMAVLSSYVGARTTANQQNGRTIRQEFTEMPTFAAATRPLAKLFVPKPPPPKTNGGTSGVVTQRSNSTQSTDDGVSQTKPTSDGESTTEQPKVTDSETGATDTQPKPSSQPKQEVKIPQDIKESNAFQYAERKGGVKVVIDDTLPKDTPAQAEVVKNADGSTTKTIRVTSDFAEQLNQGSANAKKIFAHELDHANKQVSIIDPVVRDKSGNPQRTMSQDEYSARRLLEEFGAIQKSERQYGTKQEAVKAACAQKEIHTIIQEGESLLAQGKTAEANARFAEAKSIANSYGLDADVYIHGEDGDGGYVKQYNDNIEQGSRVVTQKSNAHEGFLDKASQNLITNKFKEAFDRVLSRLKAEQDEVMAKIDAGDETLYGRFEELDNSIAAVQGNRDEILRNGFQERLKNSLKILNDANDLPSDLAKRFKALHEADDATFAGIEDDGTPTIVKLLENEVKRVESLAARVKANNRYIGLYDRARGASQDLADALSTINGNQSKTYKNIIAGKAEEIIKAFGDDGERFICQLARNLEPNVRNNTKSVNGFEKSLESLHGKIGGPDPQATIKGAVVEAKLNYALLKTSAVDLQAVNIRSVPGKPSIIDANGKPINIGEGGYGVDKSGNLTFNGRPMNEYKGGPALKVRDGRIFADTPDGLQGRILVDNSSFEADAVIVTEDSFLVVGADGRPRSMPGKTVYVDHKASTHALKSAIAKRQHLKMIAAAKAHDTEAAYMLNRRFIVGDNGQVKAVIKDDFGNYVDASQDIILIKEMLADIESQFPASEGNPRMMILNQDGENVTHLFQEQKSNTNQVAQN